MSDKPTQLERLINAARSYKGICRIDFQLPDVIDGGDPILNFPGRMWEAEQAGYSFEVIGRRNRCKIFRLVSEPEAGRGGDTSGPSPRPTVAVSTSPGTHTLFDVGRPERPHWQDAA